MATTKQAMIASEHVNGLQGTVFNMDIRAHGKDFDQYYERARAMKNIEYVRACLRIIQMPGSNDLRMVYFDPVKGYTEKDFDIVGLAVGIDPKMSVTESARKLGIEINELDSAKQTGCRRLLHPCRAFLWEEHFRNRKIFRKL